MNYKNRKLCAIKLSVISLRFLASWNCLHWASVALHRSWWAKKKLLTKQKRDWAPNLLTWTLLKIPAITQSAKYCWHSATSISGVSLAKNLPRVCNWKPQREGYRTGGKVVLHVQAFVYQAQHMDPSEDDVSSATMNSTMQCCWGSAGTGTVGACCVREIQPTTCTSEDLPQPVPISVDD